MDVFNRQWNGGTKRLNNRQDGHVCTKTGPASGQTLAHAQYTSMPKYCASRDPMIYREKKENYLNLLLLEILRTC